MAPEEFEDLAAELLEEVMGQADRFEIERHTVLRTADGRYVIDAIVRFELGGLAFLVLVEAKRHMNPIKRELVAALHQKLQSAGAHKGVLVSTSSFQRGAIEFARAHGIALATVVGGRLSLEAKADPYHQTAGRGSTSPCASGIPALVANLCTQESLDNALGKPPPVVQPPAGVALHFMQTRPREAVSLRALHGPVEAGRIPGVVGVVRRLDDGAPVDPDSGDVANAALVYARADTHAEVQDVLAQVVATVDAQWTCV